MRVGLDVTAAVVCRGGLQRYVDMLWPELAARVEVCAFALGRGDASHLRLPARRRAIPLRALEPAWRVLGWPRAETFTGPVDVVHATALTPPPTRRPLVVTVHDVLPLTHPQFFRPAATVMQRAQLRAASRAAAVVTTCQATADEIASIGGIPRERIVVAPLGVLPEGDTDLGGAGADAPVAAREPFVFAVASLTPRKGLETLARAAALLGSECPPVLVAGPDGWKSEQVRREVEAADVHGRVRFLGPVSEAALRRLYRDAAVVVHPSLAEGYGMTCLEAMALGAPLVATGIPPTVEVTADAAVLVPPGDAPALAAALGELLGDAERRAALGRAAREHASRFTWGRTADAVVQAYRLAVDGAGT